MATHPPHHTDPEQRLRDVLRLSNVGIWDWDVPSGAVEHNEQWYGILGQETGRVGNTVEAFAELIHPDDRAAVFQRIHDLLEGRAPAYVSEHRMRTPRGDIWVRDTRLSEFAVVAPVSPEVVRVRLDPARILKRV